MTRSATDRLVVAVALSLTGLLVAVLAGMAEVALFVGPWIVLCLLGLTQRADSRIQLHVAVAQDRVVTGDPIHLELLIESDAPARVTIVPDPSAGFASPGSPPLPRSVELVQPDRPSSIDLEVTATEWGTHDLGGLRIQATTPYGLFRMHGVAVEARPVLARNQDALAAELEGRRQLLAHGRVADARLEMLE